MDFLTVCKNVNDNMDKISLGDQVTLFKDLFRYPLEYKNDKYYYSNTEWDESRMKDFIQINRHWMNVSEYDRLYLHFNKSI